MANLAPDTKDDKYGSSIECLVSQYLSWMQTAGYRPRTIQETQRQLKFLQAWCEQRAITDISQLTGKILQRFQAHIRQDVSTSTQQPRCIKYQANYINTIIMFGRWLEKNQYVLASPAAGLELPKIPKRIIRNVLSYEQVQQLFALADGADTISIRDRAILATFYATGMRRQELMNLTIADLDFQKAVVFIRGGKDQKDRVVPISESALERILIYIDKVRTIFANDHSGNRLFLNKDGLPLTKCATNDLVLKYAKKLGLKGSCHLLRHSMATAMLENGADIRYIQAILGHVLLTTTQAYTKVSIRKLKEVHNLTHPAKIKPDTKNNSL